jgi:heme-degrading monooxygenase HmoA
MILEQAVLELAPDRSSEFEAAFAKAKTLIAATPGFCSLRLERCVETPGRYLLLVEWETIEAHTEGFRGSAAFDEWRRLLHHFYDPRPVVEHYEQVTTA